MSNTKLISFSALWCGPCKMTRKHIESKYGNLDTGYQWVETSEVQEGKITDENIVSLYHQMRVRSLPTLVVVDFENKEIHDSWAGYNPSNIDEYVKKYVLKSEEEE